MDEDNVRFSMVTYAFGEDFSSIGGQEYFRSESRELGHICQSVLICYKVDLVPSLTLYAMQVSLAGLSPCLYYMPQSLGNKMIGSPE